ncbi:MAG: Membrane protein implicated in regulation of rane protease [Clostridiaceae bacterium]|jgi:membrane protein implicated in regulation of membrane protease activity|nr:Membrane protein implicated in regulation of rane protease [Clostridiaceae bacterium]
MITWFIILLLSLIVELMTTSLTTIWFCIGAIFAIIAYTLNASVPVQFIVFVITSALSLIYTKPLVDKHINKKIIKTNVDAIIGQKGITLEDVDSLICAGRVMINGLPWRAVSLEETIIYKDTVVIVEKIEGVTVFIRKAN